METAQVSGIEERIRSAFPDGVIERVQVLAHGDDPGVGPTEIAARAYLSREGHAESTEADDEIVKAFTETSDLHTILQRLGDELPFVAWIEFLPFTRDEPARHSTGSVTRFSPRRSQLKYPKESQERLTPVMTRLGTADLATVDTLIDAGFANSRAEVLHWAVRRIREHPAYAQMQGRVEEIAELKTQF